MVDGQQVSLSIEPTDLLTDNTGIAFLLPDLALHCRRGFRCSVSLGEFLQYHCLRWTRKLHTSLVEHIRQQELASVIEELTDLNRPHSCIACTGGHGIGKSVLVLQAIHNPSVSATFRRRCWIDCRVLTDTSNFLEVLAREMGVPHTEFSPSAREDQLETLVAAIRQLAVV